MLSLQRQIPSIPYPNIKIKIQDKRTSVVDEVTLSPLLITTIEELKKEYSKIKSNEDNWNCYTLYNSTGTLLPNEDLISKHGMINGSILVSLYEEPQIQVQVRGLDGRTTRINTYGSWTVRRLKEEYAHWLGEGWDNVVLLYKAKRLKDEDLLSVYKVERDGFIQANIRSVGGD